MPQTTTHNPREGVCKRERRQKRAHGSESNRKSRSERECHSETYKDPEKASERVCAREKRRA